MITLFDYQQEAFNLMIEAFRTRVAALVVMATGLGKTIVAAFWAKGELKKRRKGLFLCHENGILEQAMGEFRKVIGNEVKFAPFFGTEEEKDFDADKADIVFASFQSFVDWKIVFPDDWFDFIIVDESHHGQAPTFKEVIQYFKPKKLLGITATPDRMDMLDIREIFGEEVVNYTLEEAVAKGWLTQVEYHILNDNLSHWKLKKIIKGVLEEGQRVSVKQINESIFIQKRDEEIAQTIQQYAGTSKKTIVFCEKTDHADNFQPYLPGSLTYHCKVKGGRKENRNRLDAFRRGSLQYILAVDKFNEGIDVPDAEVIVFLRCTDSKTIFFQQLGRGLRKIFGKEKVIVLDFVANCERLAMVKEMAERVKEFAGNHFELSKDVLHVSGSAFDFVFSDEQVDILNLIKRINEPFYKTWQEASEAAIALGIKNQRDYYKKYKPDPKLPSHPHLYKSFPSWIIFLGGEEKNFYPTWQEAGKVAVNLGLANAASYRKKYRQDPKLPSNPDCFYENFPSWEEFLGGEKKKHYATWQEAGAAVRSLNIKTRQEYVRRHGEDPMLPMYVQIYDDYPGWRVFVGKGKMYETWQEAGAAAVNLGINNWNTYQNKYKEDLKLPSNPDEFYKDFPDWYTFFGKPIRDFYLTWEEASRVAIALNIRSQEKYRKRCRHDPRLPVYPERVYTNFPKWKKFLGRKYEIWKEASNIAIALKIRSQLEYRKKRKCDPKLPSNPDRTYKDFPGWKKFLGKE